MKRLDVDPPSGGDGWNAGTFERAKLFGALHRFLEDPRQLARVKRRIADCAPPDDRNLLIELIENLEIGVDPGDEAIEAVLRYGNIFVGLTFRVGRNKFEDDTGFH